MARCGRGWCGAWCRCSTARAARRAAAAAGTVPPAPAVSPSPRTATGSDTCSAEGRSQSAIMDISFPLKANSVDDKCCNGKEKSLNLKLY